MAKKGRPTKYKEEYCDLLVKHMSEGLSLESFAGLIGHHKQTIYEWIRDHKSFGDAFGRGKSLSLLYWEKLGRDHIYLPHQGGTFSSSMYTLNMCNRFGWRSGNFEIKETNPDEKFKDEHELNTLNDSELTEEYKKFIK